MAVRTKFEFAYTPYSRAAVIGFWAAVIVAVAAVSSGLGNRWGLWGFRTGFLILRLSVLAGLITLAVSAAGLLGARLGPGVKKGAGLAAAGVITSLLIISIPVSWYRTAARVPPIHDITTDPVDPPEFVAVLPHRYGSPNPPQYQGGETAELQRRAYPGVKPLFLPMPRDRAFDIALKSARDMGWEIVEPNRRAGRIESTDRTFWYGFRDDISVRVTGSGDKSRIDVRSESRVGKSDLGTNAKRIEKYLSRVERNAASG